MNLPSVDGDAGERARGVVRAISRCSGVVARHPVVGVQVRRRPGRRRCARPCICDRSGLSSRNTVAVMTWYAGDRPLILRILFPEHLIGLGVVDDGRGRMNVRDQVATRVNLVARQNRVGHFARRRRGASASERGLARERPFRRIRGGAVRGLDGRFRLGSCSPLRLGSRLRLSCVGRRGADANDREERKRTDPEKRFPVHLG